MEPAVRPVKARLVPVAFVKVTPCKELVPFTVKRLVELANLKLEKPVTVVAPLKIVIKVDVLPVVVTVAANALDPNESDKTSAMLTNTFFRFIPIKLS